MTAPDPARKTTPDIVAEQIEKVARLFPECVTEGEGGARVDFDRLRATLGDLDALADSDAYTFTWAGKQEAFRAIQTPSAASRQPVPEESMNWDTTKHLFIEGENLEVLKLLYKSYVGKVKMIYIDPPYNTGNDFIYRDDYREPLKAYLEKTGQIDAEGNVLTSNPETRGRFHSDWLTMMYPRLFLARQLLRDDGVIFVSIDDNEVHHLRLLMNEVFGEEQFVADIAVVNNLKGRSDRKFIATAHEHLLMYVRSDFESRGLSLTDENLAEYDQTDERGRRFQWRDLRKRGGADTREERPNLYFPLYLNPDSGKLHLEPSGKTSVEIYPSKSDGTPGCWRWGRERVAKHISELNASPVRNSDRWNLSYRVYLSVEGEQRTRKPKSAWIGSKYSTDLAQRALKELLPGADLGAPPKPVGMLVDIVEQSMSREDICLDFFAGSCTTAQAVLEVNHRDDGNRRFIVVQIPEPTDLPGYPTIAEIGKARIRRVIQRMQAMDADEDANSPQMALDLDDDDNEPGPATPWDLGVKVFRLAPSTFRRWTPPEAAGAAALEQQLSFFDEGLKDGADRLHAVYEVLLKEGYSLNSAIETLAVGANTVYRITDEELKGFPYREGILQDETEPLSSGTQSFYLCLDNAIAPETLDALPLDAETVFICQDAALDDSQKVNLTLQCVLKTI